MRVTKKNIAVVTIVLDEKEAIALSALLNVCHLFKEPARWSKTLSKHEHFYQDLWSKLDGLTLEKYET